MPAYVYGVGGAAVLLLVYVCVEYLQNVIVKDIQHLFVDLLHWPRFATVEQNRLNLPATKDRITGEILRNGQDKSRLRYSGRLR